MLIDPIDYPSTPRLVPAGGLTARPASGQTPSCVAPPQVVYNLNRLVVMTPGVTTGHRPMRT